MDIASFSLSCTVRWHGTREDLKFPVSLPTELSQAISQNLIDNVSTTPGIHADLTVLPEFAMTADWTGRMEDKDWENVNKQEIHIDGSFRVYPAGVEYVHGDLIYKFTIECTFGTAFL